MNIRMMNRKAEEIIATTCNLMEGRWGKGHNKALVAGLESIWRTTIELQRALTDQKILEKYRIDTLEQIDRVRELINECAEVPDNQTLLHISMACQLAAQRLNHYQEIVEFAYKNKTTTESIDDLERAVA